MEREEDVLERFGLSELNLPEDWLAMNEERTRYDSRSEPWEHPQLLGANEIYGPVPDVLFFPPEQRDFPDSQKV